MLAALGLMLVEFLALAAIGWAVLGAGGGSGGSSGASAKRVAAVTGGAKLEKVKAKNSSADQAGRRKQILQNLKANEQQARKAKLTIGSRIRQSGLNFSLQTFWIGSGVLGLLAMIAGVVFHVHPLAALLFGFVAGFGLPRWMLGVLIKHRIKKFTEEFPNATDVIVRGIKSGLPVMDCLRVIGRESPEPLAAEFRRLVESLGVGFSIDQALEKMHDRMPTSEVRFFAIVLSIQQKTGGNLAEALSNLSAVLRARRLMGEKIKAMSGEAVASACIIGVLPPGIMALVYFTTPGYMLPLFEDPRGHIMLLFGAVWMGTGIFVMRRMINFKI
jgi:tight adherence protein B